MNRQPVLETKHVQGLWRSLGQTGWEIKRVNNLRNEKNLPRLLRAQGVKVPKCWWHKAEQLWISPIPPGCPNVGGGKAICLLQRGRLSRQVVPGNTVGTEASEDTDRAPPEEMDTWGLVDRKGREVERRWKEGKSQGIHSQEAPKRPSMGTKEEKVKD